MKENENEKGTVEITKYLLDNTKMLGDMYLYYFYLSDKYSDRDIYENENDIILDIMKNINNLAKSIFKWIHREVNYEVYHKYINFVKELEKQEGSEE